MKGIKNKSDDLGGMKLEQETTRSILKISIGMIPIYPRVD